MNNKERFRVKEEYPLGLGTIQIIVDVETGVNYIMNVGMTNNSITPLLDKKGKVVIEKTEKQEK